MRSSEAATVAVIGVSHADTPISLRERLSILPADLPGVLGRIRSVEGVREAAVLSTCNRVELYMTVRERGAAAAPPSKASSASVAPLPAHPGATAEKGGLGGSRREPNGPNHAAVGAGEDVLERAARELCGARGVGIEEVRESLYRMEGPGAVRHLFEVACGLDSMVPGESEVFGQVKDAYLAAVDAGTSGAELSRLFQRAFKVAKDVRSRTGISRRNVSVATVAADLARKVFGELSGSRVVLVGAGEMAELVLKTLVSGGAGPAVVANRSVESARALASRYGGEGVGLEGIEEAVGHADILVASAAAPEPIVTVRHVRAAAGARRGRPMLVVDLGVPRNVEDAASDVDGVILYDIDDLQEVVARNTAYRLEEADRARALIAEEARKFAALVKTDEVSDTIARLCSEMKRIGEGECRRTLARLGDLTEEERREVAQMAERIVAKMLHSPINTLKEEARAGKAAQMEESLRRLFGIR